MGSQCREKLCFPGVGVEDAEAEWANIILCRPYRDSVHSVSLPGTYVPGSGLSRPCGTGPVVSMGLSGLCNANLNGQGELKR